MTMADAAADAGVLAWPIVLRETVRHVLHGIELRNAVVGSDRSPCPEPSL